MKKLLSIVLSLCMMFSVIFAVDTLVFATDKCFTPLTTAKVTGFDRYTGNLGDSRFFPLDSEDVTYYDMNGTALKNGIGVWIARWNGNDEISWAKQTYRLSSMYAVLTGHYSIINDNNTDNFDTTVYFYGDGNLLDSYRITNANYYEDIKVDVMGVDSLTILVKDNRAVSRGTYFALYDMFFHESFDNGVVAKQPSCYYNGVKVYTCTGCGYVRNESIPKVSHSFGNNEKNCLVCGTANPNYVAPYIPPVPQPKATCIKKVTAGKKQLKLTWKAVSGVTGYQIQYSTDKKFKKANKTVTVKGGKKTSTTVKKLKSKKTYYVRIRTYKGKNYSAWSKAKTVKVK